MSIAIWKGDCLEVMEKLPSKSIDCFICDLPYGCLAGGAGQEKKKRRNLIRYIDGIPTNNSAIYDGGVIGGCAWDIKINLEKFWIQVKRLAKNDNTPVLMFCTTKFGAELIASNPKWFRYDLVWDKGQGVSFLSANKMPMRSHEMIYVFSKAGAFYNRVDIEGDFKKSTGGGSASVQYGQGKKKNWDKDNTGKRCALSVIQQPKSFVRNGHPTKKPYELYEWLLTRYCPAGGTLLDPTAGSFTSCKVAKDLGHKAIGIEMNSKFFYKTTGELVSTSKELLRPQHSDVNLKCLDK